MRSKVRFKIPVEMVADCEVRAAQSARGAVLLLHGYAESGAKMLKRLDPWISSDLTVLAPNGLFPVPSIAEDRSQIREGYSWYFYDFLTDDYLIDMAPAIAFLRGVLEHFGVGELPLIVIGFSQGGYLAPFVGSRLPSTRQVIGIGCRFLDEEIEGPLPFRLDAVHGEEDPIIDSVSARKSHERLLARGTRGSFEVVPGQAHRLSPELLRRVGALLALE